jgi:hypothetical protein
MTSPIDQLTAVCIGGAFLATILTSKGFDMTVLLIILIIIAVTAVAFGFVEAEERRKR